MRSLALTEWHRITKSNFAIKQWLTAIAIQHSFKSAHAIKGVARMPLNAIKKKTKRDKLCIYSKSEVIRLFLCVAQ